MWKVQCKIYKSSLFSSQAFKLEISDDPFEVKLGDNYELLKDEYNEGKKRRAVLDQKVHALKQGYKIIPSELLQNTNISDTLKNYWNYSYIWTMWIYHRVMHPKDADRMANSVDPDQSPHSLIWVYTVSPDLPVWKLRIITVPWIS